MVAIEVAKRLRARGEDPVAVSADAIAVYRGLETLSGAPTAEERAELEHRLVGIAEAPEEFSAGRFAELARCEVDALMEQRRRPIVVGGTGLYMRAALAEIKLKPPVPTEVRAEVEREITERGSAALHEALDPDLAATVHPNDRKRVARMTELERAGLDPPRDAGALWTTRLRHPSLLIGLTMDRQELVARVARRVEEMAAGGAAEEARIAANAGASRTARAAIGFDEFQAGDLDTVRREHSAYARRQLTWMRKMPGIHLIDRTGASDDAVAAQVMTLLGENGAE